MATSNKYIGETEVGSWVHRWWTIICSSVVVVLSLGSLYVRLHDLELRLSQHKEERGHTQTYNLVESMNKDLILLKHQISQQADLAANQRKILDRLTGLEKDTSIIQSILSRIEKSSEKRQ
jgi:tRNA C32,U32 (ribose-2'-O)-methylase TrmJ